MSNLLIDEPPLQVLPSLAEKIGLNEAIMLQQIHYWIQRSDNREPDQRGRERTWVWKTLDEWADEFSFWSKSTIRRTLQSLKDEQLIIAEKKRKERGDMTTWYAINYGGLGYQQAVQDEQVGSVQDEQMGCSKRTDGGSKVNTSARGHNAHTRSETTTETTTERRPRARVWDTEEMFEAILQVMRETGTISRRHEDRAYSLAKELVGEHPPRVVANALREDLDGSLRGWNGEVFKDSVLPEYIESTTDTKPESAQEMRGGTEKTHSRPDDIRSEIR